MTFPNQGVRMKPFGVLSVKDRDGNLLEENRASQRRHPRRHGVRDDEPAARRPAARHGPVGGGGQPVAAAGEDRHGRRQHRRVVHGFDPNITVVDSTRRSRWATRAGRTAALPICRFPPGYDGFSVTRTIRRRSRRPATSKVPRGRSAERRGAVVRSARINTEAFIPHPARRQVNRRRKKTMKHEIHENTKRRRSRVFRGPVLTSLASS
jgi:hypothetical protein